MFKKNCAQMLIALSIVAENRLQCATFIRGIINTQHPKAWLLITGHPGCTSKHDAQEIVILRVFCHNARKRQTRGGWENTERVVAGNGRVCL